MKFGKVENVSDVDFFLPQDPRGTIALLKKSQKSERPLEVFIGCPAWSCKEWIGKYYPAKTKPADFLHHYSRQFNTIELNTTHYRIPTVETVEKWKAAVPKDFVFCPKIPQYISHRKYFQQTNEAIIQFTESINKFELNLGISFMQLPPYFQKRDLWSLENFIKNFPKEVPLSIEFRHESWFETHDSFMEVADLLEEHGISTVITDVAGRREVLHQRLSSSTLVLRLVGNNLHKTDYERVDSWVVKIKEWYRLGLTTAYIFVHEPDDVYCPELATYLVKKLNDQLNLKLKAPQLIKQETQGTLF